MHARLALATLLVLVAAGCTAPSADLDAAALSAVLDSVDIVGATVDLLPNGDRILHLAGETAGVEEYEFIVPPGLTNVEVAILQPADRSFSATVVAKDSGLSFCRGIRSAAWGISPTEPFRCAALAANAEGQTWVLRVANVGSSDLVTGRAAAPFEVAITLSAQPLDGSAALIKLDQLSRPEFALLDTESSKVASSEDGALLHVEVTRPDTDAKVPTILIASPYNTPDREADGMANIGYAKHWAARGYAFASMDLRGTGISGGCFSFRGPIDLTDIKDVVDWLGTQEWSDGKVGMFGVSYEGFTPVAAAVAQPEHLTAIYAIAPAIDMYTNYVPGGVNTGRTASTGILGYVVGHAVQTTDDPSNPLGPVEYRAGAVCDPAALAVGNDPRDLYTEFFAERNLTAMTDRIQVPVYLEQGFWDNPVKANHVPQFFNALDVPKRGVFGSWEHALAVRADHHLMVEAWFDHWLKGRDTGIMDTPVVEVLTNTRMMRADSEWPSSMTTLAEVPLEPGRFVSHPVPLDAPLPMVATTMSEPYPDGLYITGVPAVHFSASLPRGGNAYLHAELWEETPTGERSLVIMGWLNAAHMDGHEIYVPFTPGETRELEMQLLPVDHVVQPGNRLVLVMRSTSGDDGYGGPEGGLTEPGLVEVSAGSLRLPTLPLSSLSVAPRSAGAG